MLKRSLDKRGEQRVRRFDGGAVLRVKLHTHKPGVRRNGHDLDEVVLRVDAHRLKACGGEFRAKGVVELEAVAVALLNKLASVELGKLASGLEGAVAGAEAHGSALVGDVLLAGHEVNYGVGRFGIHLA